MNKFPIIACALVSTGIACGASAPPDLSFWAVNSYRMACANALTVWRPDRNADCDDAGTCSEIRTVGGPRSVLMGVDVVDFDANGRVEWIARGASVHAPDGAFGTVKMESWSVDESDPRWVLMRWEGQGSAAGAEVRLVRGEAACEVRPWE